MMPFFLDDIVLRPELMMNDGRCTRRPPPSPRIRDKGRPLSSYSAGTIAR